MLELEPILTAIRSGVEVMDPDFNRAFPEGLRRLAEIHFTPIDVARRAAALLVTRPGTRVLDVGSGPGKFCLVGALTTLGSFTGVERNHTFVEIARDLAGRYRIPRVRFIHGDATIFDWTGYDAFYLFNPFAVMLGEPGGGAGTRDAEPEVRSLYARIVHAQLAARPAGTRVVTFHGLGGELPASYERTYVEGHGVDVLELWVKRTEAS